MFGKFNVRRKTEEGGMGWEEKSTAVTNSTRVMNTSIAYVKNNQENRGKRERDRRENKWKKREGNICFFCLGACSRDMEVMTYSTSRRKSGVTILIIRKKKTATTNGLLLQPFATRRGRCEGEK
jgi:hypothetical protein